jgi:hypothetical protein
MRNREPQGSQAKKRAMHAAALNSKASAFLNIAVRLTKQSDRFPFHACALFACWFRFLSVIDSGNAS